MLIFYFYMAITKTYKVKNSLSNFRKDWNKFPEISELTTLSHDVCVPHWIFRYGESSDVSAIFVT